MYRIYQIENENNLEEIAKKFNTTEDKLKQINGIMENFIIRPGGFIIVPIGDAIENQNFETYIVKPGDTIFAIAQKYNINYKDLLDLNGLDKDQYIYPNQQIMVPKEGVNFRITNENETLFDLAKTFNTTEDEIIRQNETIYLMPDQVIVYKKRA